MTHPTKKFLQTAVEIILCGGVLLALGLLALLFLSLLTAAHAAETEYTIALTHRVWYPDTSTGGKAGFEWHFNEAIYSRDIGTRAEGIAIGVRRPYMSAQFAYLGHMEERFAGTRQGRYTNRVAETDLFGINVAFTPHLGPVYAKFGGWLHYHYNKEFGEQFGQSFNMRHTGVNRSGELGIGYNGAGWYTEVTYMNRVYTRESTLGAEYRQMYMGYLGLKFR